MNLSNSKTDDEYYPILSTQAPEIIEKREGVVCSLSILADRNIGNSSSDSMNVPSTHDANVINDYDIDVSFAIRKTKRRRARFVSFTSPNNTTVTDEAQHCDESEDICVTVHEIEDWRSILTEHEKQQYWYTRTDFDRFSREWEYEKHMTEQNKIQKQTKPKRTIKSKDWANQVNLILGIDEELKNVIKEEESKSVLGLSQSNLNVLEANDSRVVAEAQDDDQLPSQPSTEDAKKTCTSKSRFGVGGMRLHLHRKNKNDTTASATKSLQQVPKDREKSPFYRKGNGGTYHLRALKAQKVH